MRPDDISENFGPVGTNGPSLIERLRALSRHEHSDYSIGDEAADALEAAREDGARLDWLDKLRGDDVQGSYPDEPQLVGHYWSIGGQCTDVRTAIDAAREARND